MRKRFGWTMVISAVIISLIIPINLTLVSDVSPSGQSRLNFFSLMVVQALLIIIISFQFVNEFFTQHPGYHSLLEKHKIEKHKEITGIPEKYYKPINGKNDDE